MPEATLTIDPAFTVGTADPRLFGSFVEHLGRCVYTGIYEPGHPAAGADGFRGDVLALVRELGVTVVRYPGGNFVSGYRWEDGVGPDRPARLDPAWRSIEPNTFGLNDFMAWCHAAGTAPMMAVNLGTRGVQEACDLLEYANHPGGTRLSDLRAAHGAATPHGIRMWCLGNEMDGPWQTGFKTAQEYGRLAAQTARAMRTIDPDLELTVCGSSGRDMPTFGDWESTVLEHTYDSVDHVSLHAYYEQHGADAASFLASGHAMEEQIAAVVATCDAVRARLRARRRMTLSFDEWNVWYLTRWQERERDRAARAEWGHAPRLLEDHYSVTDAVVVGDLLIALLRNCDRVRIACLAQLVNVIAPIVTEPGGRAWRQTTFHPFAQASRYGRGEVLRIEPAAPALETARHGAVPALHAVAVRGDDGATTLFAVNRSPADSLDLVADVRALGGCAVAEHTVLADADPDARNTADSPDRVRPRAGSGRGAAVVDDGRLRAGLPPASWTVIRLR
jgi:alpha-N-arabinofuranosidase